MWKGEDSILLSKFVDNLDIFLDVLVPDTQKLSIYIPTSFGKPIQPLGIRKITILNFILTLVSFEPDFTSILVEIGFYGLIFELFFEHPTNNILHDYLLQFFLLLCTRDQDEVMEVMLQTNLLDRIGQVWSGIKTSDHNYHKTLFEGSKLTPSMSSALLHGHKNCGVVSYFGHLVILANMIDDSSEGKDWDGFQELVQTSEKWKVFVQEVLEKYNLLTIPHDTM
eukprot:TRINITY_DN7995_c0_g1_i1.p1 TRINITY_DN7995_c0_g1~~TRINITY_DN7995_c0_g1_i1.p1  ORF type:complete len:224 (-),score=39.46 TRINITY_DN7995_c0_g1_i1:100-771(-)